MNRHVLPVLISPLLAFLVFLLATPAAVAQFAQRGGLSGTVFDSSGAVIAGAQITLLDIAQNQTRQLKADSSGHFEFDNVAAGQYRLTAVADGFQRTTSEAITVTIGAISRYDFRLKPGSVDQTVTVSAEAAGLETEHTSVETNITTRQFEDLPLNGRNFTQVAALAPGVSTYQQANVNPGGTYAVGAMFAMGGTAFTAGGAPQGSRDTGFYINGVNVNDNYESSISFAPSTEALQTATVQVTDFSAAVGHDIAGLNVQTKSGSSKFHGAAYDFLENDAMNAFNPWDNAVQIITASPIAKPVLKRNQFGGNLGGPIPIPGLKNRLFFFVNYEDFIEHGGNQLVTASVPSAAELTGDFSELLGTNPNPVQLYNPYFTTYTGGVSTRPAIPNNRLDLATRPNGSALADPNSAAILKALWPAPNHPSVPSNAVNFTAYQAPGISNYHIDTRFDGKITSNDSIFVTWSKSNGHTTLTGGLTPNQLHNFPVQDQSLLITANYLHIFTQHLTNEFIFGTGDGALVTMQQSLFGWYNGNSNPLNSLFQNTGDGLNKGVLGVLAGGNYASAGTGEVFRAENESWQVSDNLDWVRGRHTLSAGMNYFRKSEIDWDFTRQVSFGTTYGNGFGSDAINAFSASGSDLGYQGGDGIADLEMGIPSNMWVRYTINGGGPTAPNYNIVFPYWGLYVNDKFRLNPKLTISAGLRYDLSIPDYTPNPSVAPCCAIYTPNSAGGILEYPGIAAGLPTHYLSASKTAFAPRLSVAYNFRPRTIIRAGYGIFYDTGASQISNTVGNAIYGTSAAVNYNVDNITLGVPVDTPTLNLTNIFPVPQTTTLGSFLVSTGKGQGYPGDGQWTSIHYSDQNSTRLPYIQRMLLDVQQQIGTHDVVTISYAGAQGRRGWNYVNLNLPPYQTDWPSGGGSGDPVFDGARPNSVGRFGDIFVQRPNINSFYNALIVQYRHNFSRGFQITSNYTWSKTVSDYPLVQALYSNGTPGYGSIGTGFQYPNLYDRGESNQSHPQRFVFSGIWTPEYGRSWPKVARIPLSGWRFSGIMTLESGDALTVTNGGPATPCPAIDAGTSRCPTGFGTSAQDGDNFDELMVSGNPNIGHFSKTLTQQFNTAAFSLPPMNVRGNSGLGTVRGPGQYNFDLSLAKTFAIRETLRFELRGDAFNAFNHTQWNGINTTYPSGDAQFPFGQVNGAREARIVQVAAKLAF
jgi:hypothetical protein